MTFEGRYCGLPSVCDTCGGRIFAFRDANDLGITRTFYTKFGEAWSALFTWVFVRDNVLVQLNGRMTQHAAAEYEQALQALEANAARVPTTAAPDCVCDRDAYDCTDAEAGLCFDECNRRGAGDIHRLDGDGDGVVCE